MSTGYRGKRTLENTDNFIHFHWQTRELCFKIEQVDLMCLEKDQAKYKLNTFLGYVPTTLYHNDLLWKEMSCWETSHHGNEIGKDATKLMQPVSSLSFFFYLIELSFVSRDELDIIE